MKELRSLTGAELERVAERFRNPIQGGKVEAAKRYGVDVSLLLEQLSLTPAARVQQMQLAAATAERVRGAARRAVK